MSPTKREILTQLLAGRMASGASITSGCTDSELRRWVLEYARMADIIIEETPEPKETS